MSRPEGMPDDMTDKEYVTKYGEALIRSKGFTDRGDGVLYKEHKLYQDYFVVLIPKRYRKDDLCIPTWVKIHKSLLSQDINAFKIQELVSDE